MGGGGLYFRVGWSGYTCGADTWAETCSSWQVSHVGMRRSIPGRGNKQLVQRPWGRCVLRWRELGTKRKWSWRGNAGRVAWPWLMGFYFLILAFVFECNGESPKVLSKWGMQSDIVFKRMMLAASVKIGLWEWGQKPGEWLRNLWSSPRGGAGLTWAHRGGDEKTPNSGYNLKMEPVGFMARYVVKSEKERGQGGPKAVGLSTGRLHWHQ